MTDITWLLEPEVFQKDLYPFIEELNKQNKKVVIHKLGKAYEDYIFDTPFISLVSMQFAKVLLKNKNSLWLNAPTFHKYDCNYYYPRFKENLLNNDYFIVPAGDVQRQGNRLIRNCLTSNIFVRPCSQLKSFNGTAIVTNEDWNNFLKTLKLRTNPEDLVLFAPFNKIKKEWRAVITKNCLVTISQYKEHDETVRIEGAPLEVMDYISKLLSEVKYNPDPVWVLDICETGLGIHVLEVGPFACCGLYKADPKSIIDLFMV